MATTEKELKQLQQLRSELSAIKKIMEGIQQRINHVEETIYFKCDHFWIIDRSNMGEHTEHICTRCNMAKNDNFNHDID